MFSDKNRPLSVSVSSVHHFYAAPGVKSLCTDDTDTHPALKFGTKPQIGGYIISMTTATGTWYYNGRSVDGSVLGWTRELRKAWIYASERVCGPAAEEKADDIRALTGDQAIVNLAVLPIRKTPIGRCEIIDEEQS